MVSKESKAVRSKFDNNGELLSNEQLAKFNFEPSFKEQKAQLVAIVQKYRRLLHGKIVTSQALQMQREI